MTANDLSPRSTVHGYFDRWDYDGTLDRIHDMLCLECREQAEREASPTAASEKFCIERIGLDK